MAKKIVVILIVCSVLLINVQAQSTDPAESYLIPYGLPFLYGTNYNLIGNSGLYKTSLSLGQLSDNYTHGMSFFPVWLITDNNLPNQYLSGIRDVKKGYTYEYSVTLNFRPHIQTNTVVPFAMVLDTLQQNTDYVTYKYSTLPELGLQSSYYLDQNDTPGMYILRVQFYAGVAYDPGKFDVNLLGFRLDIPEGSLTTSADSYLQISMNPSKVIYDPNGSYFQESVEQGLADIKQSIDDGFSQNHDDLEDVKGRLEGLNESVLAGNQQAHEDAEALRQTIDEQLDREKEEAESSGNGFVDDATSAFNGLDTTSLGQVFRQLWDSLSKEPV